MPDGVRERFSLAFSMMGDTVSRTVKPVSDMISPPTTPEGRPPPPKHPARIVQELASTAMAVINLPVELANAGFAALTDPIARALPEFTAATIGSLYVAPFHTHMHPPSLTPPNPVPVPLPSLGPITLGTSVTVLINSLPAARAGDFGFAPTCGGFYPLFEVITGSSKVFIGGMRAARVVDFCRACHPSTTLAARGAASAMAAAAQVVALTGVVADAIDYANENADAAMQSALGLRTAMGAAQMAADAVAMAMLAAMGSDPAAPVLSSPGIITLPVGGNVQIGGFPVPTFPNVAILLLRKLKSLRDRRRRARNAETDAEPTSCPI